MTTTSPRVPADYDTVAQEMQGRHEEAVADEARHPPLRNRMHLHELDIAEILPRGLVDADPGAERADDEGHEIKEPGEDPGGARLQPLDDQGNRDMAAVLGEKWHDEERACALRVGDHLARPAGRRTEDIPQEHFLAVDVEDHKKQRCCSNDTPARERVVRPADRPQHRPPPLLPKVKEQIAAALKNFLEGFLAD